MAQAKQGDTVKVHYTGKLEDGSVFDSSVERDPIQFTIGQKMVIPGFENAVVDMTPGDKATVSIPSDEAYGPVRDELLVTIERSQIPSDVDPQVGQVLKFQKQPDKCCDKDGCAHNETIVFSVVGVTDTHLNLDANHPLAGKDLTFDIELVEIV